MDKILYKAQAVRYVVTAVAILLLITIWPLRIWQREVVRPAPAGTVTYGGAAVNDESDAAQRFLASFDRLGAVDLYFYGFTYGRYISFSIINESYDTIYSAYVDLNDEDFPGMVRIPVNVALTPGKEYTVLLLGCYSTYELGIESISDWAEEDTRQFTTFFLHDTEVTGQALNMELIYTPPINRLSSLLRMGLLILLCAGVWIVTEFALKREKEARPEGTITVGKLLRVTLLPLNIVFFIVLLFFTLTKRYNDALGENLFLALGLLIACALLTFLIIYATDAEAARTFGIKRPLPVLLRRFALMGAIALLIAFSCEYMNGLFDIDHQIAERKEAAAFAAVLVLMLIPDGRKEKEKRLVRITPYGILTAVLFVLLIIFRNGRMWGVALAVGFTLFYLAYAYKKRDAEWTEILSGGLTLHFVCGVVYCMLFRVFAGFVSARYGFLFHTVTVTAEYLTMMAAVAAALMIRSLKSKRRFAYYPSTLLFGTVMAYAILTMSRTAYLAIAVMCLCMVLLCALARGHAAKLLALMVCAALLCFPAVFSLQRILPSMVNRAAVFAVEDTSSFLRGAAAWDHTHYMTLERFTGMFNEKILNRKGGSYRHPIDRYNYDENADPIYGPNGIPLEEWERIKPEEEEIVAQSFDMEQFSNGRLTIWRHYLAEMNVTGHEDMGVLLPGGEMAVHAHNTYLQAAFDNGILTGIVFVFFVGIGICHGVIYYIRRKTLQGVSALPVAVSVGFAIAALTEWVFLFSNPMTLGLLFAIAPLVLRFPVAGAREKAKHRTKAKHR